MAIFDEMFEQYTQLASRNKQYKRNLQILPVTKGAPLAKNTAEISSVNVSRELAQNSSSISIPHNENSTSIRDLYDQMEFDARRYNRNFDAQTGVI